MFAILFISYMDFWSFSIRFKRTSVTNQNLGKTFNSSSELPIIFDRVDFCPDFCANVQFRTEKFRMALIAGGLPDLSLFASEATEYEPTAYEGCMRDLVVNGKHYHLNEIGNAAARACTKSLGQYKGSIPERESTLALKPRTDITRSPGLQK